jgi:long-chain fatty acid transport protein
MEIKKRTLVIAVATLCFPVAAMATNGYFSHGYGIKAKGMGGAAVAMADDAFGGANNPASMVFAGGRFDTGVDLFNPQRSASRSGSANSMMAGDPGRDGAVDSDTKFFAIPELGYNKMLSESWSAGISIYGNGGLNTNFPGGQVGAGRCGPGAPPSNLLCGQGNLGVDMMQLIFAPTMAFKIAANHSIGIAPLIGYQRFKAEGLQAFAGMSLAPGKLTNVGYDNSFGFGARIGYMGKLTPAITIGAAYASKMDMHKFDKYGGLFAEQGKFDIPANYSAGVALQVAAGLTLALDYQRIKYSAVQAIGNSSTNRLPLGSDGGPGFGWQDVQTWKLGAVYQPNAQWTLRAGYNKGDSPVNARDITFNLLAPGVITKHATLGATYLTTGGGEWTVSGMHGFDNAVSGPSPMLGGIEKAAMRQTSIGIAFGWKI